MNWAHDLFRLALLLIVTSNFTGILCATDAPTTQEASPEVTGTASSDADETTEISEENSSASDTAENATVPSTDNTTEDSTLPDYIDDPEVGAVEEGPGAVEADPAAEKSVTEIIKEVFAKYDRRVPPQVVTGEPAEVTISVFVREIHSISSDDMQYTILMNLQRSWNDPRLDYRRISNASSQIVLRNEFAGQLWIPDVYFDNERESKFHVITIPNEAIWLSSDGTVSYKSRYSVILSCTMDLHGFPFDSQICNMFLKTYTHNLKEVQLRWRQVEPIEIPPNLFLQSFKYQDKKLEECSATSNVPCLRAKFLLERQYQYYLITTYLPSTFVTCVSWVSFWVSPDAIPGRITLGSTTVLTVITQQFIGGLSLPQVPYVKAVDIWLTGCIIFVFTALVEFAIVNVASRADARRAIAKEEEEEDDPDNPRNKDDPDNPENPRKEQPSVLYQVAKYLSDLKPRREKSWAARIDFVSRFLFPLAFVAFSLFYRWYFVMNLPSGEELLGIDEDPETVTEEIGSIESEISLEL